MGRARLPPSAPDSSGRPSPPAALSCGPSVLSRSTIVALPRPSLPVLSVLCSINPQSVGSINSAAQNASLLALCWPRCPRVSMTAQSGEGPLGSMRPYSLCAPCPHRGPLPQAPVCPLPVTCANVPLAELRGPGPPVAHEQLTALSTQRLQPAPPYPRGWLAPDCVFISI